MAEGDQERWDDKHAGKGADERPPPAWLLEIAPSLPPTGRALDVASGRGRIARWLADRGLEVTALDVSPVALAQIDHAGVTGLAHDLEADPTLPAGPFDVVTLFFYRQPALASAIARVLAPGGLLVAEHPTVTNLERHMSPSRRWLAEPGELRQLAAGLSVERYEEGWHDGRHTARLLARKG